MKLKQLKTCPRVENGSLIRPIRRCAVRGRQMPAADAPDVCCAWNQLRNKNDDTRTHFRCVIREE